MLEIIRKGNIFEIYGGGGKESGGGSRPPADATAVTPVNMMETPKIANAVMTRKQ